MIVDRKNLAAGAIFFAIGAFYGVVTWQTLDIGSALQMGPGYFPLILSGFMVLIGAVVAASGLRNAAHTEIGLFAWRAMVLLALATIVFGTFLDELGLLPTVFVSSLIASFASREVTPVRALIVSLGVALFCTLVFSYGIGITAPVFGHWFGG